MTFISLSNDTQDVQQALEKTSLTIPQINKKFLTVIGKNTLKVVKSGIKSTYSPPSKYYKRTGQLIKTWTYKATTGEVSIYPRILYQSEMDKRKNRQWAMGISSALSYGTSDGRIKPRSFIQVGKNYVMTDKFKPEVQAMIDKELKKLGW